MKRVVLTLSVFFIGAVVGPYARAQYQVNPDEARAIAKDAYIYGYPLQDQYRIIFAFTVYKGSAQYMGPFNTVMNVARVYTPDDQAFVSPNADTPYTFVALDLRTEPYVLTVPPVDGKRYFSFQMMDLYTYNFKYVGTRTTGNEGGSYLIVGPNWKGEAPPGVKEVIRAETELVSLVGRTQLFGPDDLENVKEIQAGYKVQALSSYLSKPGPAPAPPVNWAKPLPPGQERTNLDFFGVLNFVLQFCPTPPDERAIRENRDRAR